MQRKYHSILMIAVGVLLVLTATIWLVPVTPANAQCGSQASSCKNCHEVQGEMPVNNDGTAWHQSHAFGDFCYICHAGNNQATDKAEAHMGMEAPLSDVKASCQQCHVADLDARAEVYATALGVEVGAGASTTVAGRVDASASVASSSNQTASVGPASVPASTALDVDDPNMVDYVQRYETIVLGMHQTNWGNISLVVLISLLVVGGGGFVLFRENWIHITTEELEPLPEGHPAEIVEMLPNLEALSDKGRQGLKKLIENPDAANELLDVVARHTKKGN